MGAERKTGLGALPAGLLRPTTPQPPEPGEAGGPADDRDGGGEVAEAADRAGGPAAAPRASRNRRRRPPAEGETRGRKLVLPDSIHDRLRLLASQRRSTVSAVAADLLDKALPRFRVEREG